MRTLRILHLASFNGNIGDNANHNGTYYLWKKYLKNYVFEYTQLEMRTFYRNEEAFNDAFADYVNTFDLLVIGGGNYFALWVESSVTGTTVAIPQSTLKRIKTPIVFYALGMDIHNGFSERTVAKFTSFLDTLFSSTQFFVSVRNDGSQASARKVLGDVYAQQLKKVPDGGFFIQIPKSCPDVLTVPQDSKIRIGINLAGDMLEKRYGGNGSQESLAYLTAFASLLEAKAQELGQVEYVLYPHIYKDFTMYTTLFGCCSDSFVRNNISVAPYLHGQGAEVPFFSAYSKATLNIATRFHANVCSTALGIPTIGLHTYDQIPALYRELELENACVPAKTPADVEQLEALLDTTLAQAEQVKHRNTQVMKRLEQDAECFFAALHQWLSRHF